MLPSGGNRRPSRDRTASSPTDQRLVSSAAGDTAGLVASVESGHWRSLSTYASTGTLTVWLSAVAASERNTSAEACS